MALPNPDWENTHYYCCTEIWMLSSLLLKEVWYLPSVWMFGVKHNDSGKHNTRKITNCKKKSHKSTWVFQTKVRTMTDNIHLHSMRLYIYIYFYKYVAFTFPGALLLIALYLSVEWQSAIGFLQPPRELLIGQPTFGTLNKQFPFPHTKKTSISTHSGHDRLTCLIPPLHSSSDHSYSHRDCEHMLSLKNPNKTSAFCFSICANTQPKYYQSKV